MKIIIGIVLFIAVWIATLMLYNALFQSNTGQYLVSTLMAGAVILLYVTQARRRP